MPFPGIPSNYRLGIANTQVSNGNDFTERVLGLPSASSPIYQQGISKGLTFGGGWARSSSADWGCNGGSDNDIGRSKRHPGSVST